MAKPDKIRQELLDHLRAGNAEVFINFCIVLYDKRGKEDIVEDEFGLNIADLRRWKGEIQKKRAEAMQQEQAVVEKRPEPSTSGGSQVEEPFKKLQKEESPRPGNVGEDTVDNGGGISQETEMASTSTGIQPMEDGDLNKDYKDLIGSEWEALRKTIEFLPHEKVVVALLDTGVYTKHPDLKNMVKVNSNCIGKCGADNKFTPNANADEGLEIDDASHGTMSAGILWQYAGEKIVEIHNYKVTTKDRSSEMADVARALEQIKKWDIDQLPLTGKKVNIILMTFGCSHRDDEVDKLLSELGEEKVLICSASNKGESSATTVGSPANHGSVIAVGSCDRNGKKCGHSSVGQSLDFLFPGKNIKSTSSKHSKFILNSRYGTSDGTSFAAPHCAALVALILIWVETQFTAYENKDGTHWREVLTKTSRMRDLMAQTFADRKHDTLRGYGIPHVDHKTANNSIEGFLISQFKP